MNAHTGKVSRRFAVLIIAAGTALLLLTSVLASQASAVEPSVERNVPEAACLAYGFGIEDFDIVIPRGGDDGDAPPFTEVYELGDGATLSVFSPPNRSRLDFSAEGVSVAGAFLFNRNSNNKASFYDYRLDPAGPVTEGTLMPPPRDNGNEKKATFCFSLRTDVTIDKTTNGADRDPGVFENYIPVGETVTWEYRVSIPGTEPANALTQISVTDDQGVEPAFVGGDDGDGLLELGETWTYRATAPSTAGPYSNVGTVTATGAASGDVVTASDGSGYFGSNPSIAVTATTAGFEPGASDPYTEGDGVFIRTGDDVEWRYLVTNTGNVPLTSVGVLDTAVSGITCATDALGPGESTTCSASGTAIESTIGVFFENVGTATGLPPTGSGDTPSASDASSYFGYVSSFDVDVLLNGEPYDQGGSFPVIVNGVPVTWTFIVTNTGNVPVTATIVAQIEGAGETIVCSADELGDVPPGDVEGNPATCDFDAGTAAEGETTTSFEIRGNDPNGNEVSESVEEVGFFGGIACGDSIRFDGPDIVGDGPDVGFVLGPDSKTGAEGCAVPVEITAALTDETQSTNIGPPEGYTWVNETGIATITWDAVPRTDDPLDRTVQLFDGGTSAVIPFCAVVVDITLRADGDYELTSPTATYPTATDTTGDGEADRDVCLIRQLNTVVEVGPGVYYTQLEEVFYLWNDPNFSRPR